VLASIRIKLGGRRIRYVAAVQVGNNGDVIPYLVLVGPAFLRIEGVAHRYIGRPTNAGIRAARIKQSRKEITCIVSRCRTKPRRAGHWAPRQMCRTTAVGEAVSFPYKIVPDPTMAAVGEFHEASA
jgi:hypothetical protein